MNLIENIEIKNFKSIRHQKIEGCKRVNVFLGYPNVGKSNILEALGIYSSFQLKNHSFKFNEICRVKHFSELFFDRNTSEAVNIIINKDILAELIITESNDLDVRIHRLIKSKDGENSSVKIFSATVINTDFSFKVSQERHDQSSTFLFENMNLKNKYLSINKSLVH